MAGLPESEKITVNLGHVDLGQVDLLVAERFYSNRSDFVRTAVRALLQRHEAGLAAAMERRQPELGLRRITRAELERAAEAGAPLHLHVLGLAVIEPDVTPELAQRAIASLDVLGALQAPPAVRAALKDRTG